MPSEMKDARRPVSSAFSIARALVWSTVAGVAFLVLAPAITCRLPNCGRDTAAKNHLQQAVIAIRGFQTEYGHFPKGEQTQNGDQEFSGANQKDLFNILRNREIGPVRQNYRNFVYFEGRELKPSSVLKNGIAPDGTFYDPWGNSYSFVVDADGDGQVTVPDSWHTADSGKKLSTLVIGFSLGKDRNSPKDDITTW